MARDWAWFAGVHVLLVFGCVMEEHASGSHDFLNTLGGLSAALWTASAVAYAMGALAVGVIFDRLGPKASLLVSHTSYMAYEVSVWLGFIQLSRFLRILTHPLLIPWALAARECSAQARVGFLGRGRLTQLAVLVVFGHVHLPLVVHAGKAFFLGLPLVSLALGFYLCRPAPGSDSCSRTLAHRGQDDAVDAACIGSADVELAAAPFLPGAAESSAQVAEACSGMHDSVARILARPSVLMAFALSLTMNYLRDTQGAALAAAFLDPSEPYFDGETYGLVHLVMFYLFLLSFTFLPALSVRKLGPTLVMQVLLAVAAVVLVFDALLCLMPAGMRLGQGLLLNLSAFPLQLAQEGADFTATVFLLGVVDPSERGTLLGLIGTCGPRGSIPLPLFVLVGRLYGLGGLPAIFVLNSGICFAMLLLFRKSALMHVRLKEA